VFSTLSGVSILGDTVVYTKSWSGNYTYNITDKKIEIASVKADGTGRKTISQLDQTYPAPPYNNVTVAYISSYQSAPSVIMYQYSIDKTVFYKYDASTFAVANVTSIDYAGPHYLLSPAGDKTLWAEQRDGKNTIFVGDSLGNNGKMIAQLSEFTPYGWATEDYIF
jgi:hypothetical protein